MTPPAASEESETRFPRILYIAGYGRSGSTALSAVLSGHSSITSVGEVTFLHGDWANSTRICACGTAYADCPFWGELVRNRGDAGQLADLTRRVERITFLPRLWIRLPGSRRAREYGRVQRSLFRYVQERSSASVVVDASKSARAASGRALALAELAGLEVFVLHLVRSGRSTLESLVATGGNWVLEGHRPPRRLPALRATMGWVAANLSAMALRRRLGEDRYLRLRYEDLVSDPRRALRSIGKMLGLDMEAVIDRVRKGEAFEVGHLVGGNRVRFSSRIRLKTTPSAGRHQVNPMRRLPFTLFGTWLERAYGYED